MSFWDTPAGREGLAAWHADRADLSAVSGVRAVHHCPDCSGTIDTAAAGKDDRTAAVCACGEPAVARLVIVNADGTEHGRSEPKCHQHLQAGLDVFAALAVDDRHAIVSSL